MTRWGATARSDVSASGSARAVPSPTCRSWRPRGPRSRTSPPAAEAMRTSRSGQTSGRSAREARRRPAVDPPVPWRKAAAHRERGAADEPGNPANDESICSVIHAAAAGRPIRRSFAANCVRPQDSGCVHRDESLVASHNDRPSFARNAKAAARSSVRTSPLWQRSGHRACRRETRRGERAPMRADGASTFRRPPSTMAGPHRRHAATRRPNRISAAPRHIGHA